MPRCWLMILMLLNAMASKAGAQGVPPLAMPYNCPRPGPSRIPYTADTYPFEGTSSPPALPNGQAVSQPLQAVILPDSPPKLGDSFISPGENLAWECTQVGVLPDSWHDWEYLLWWPKSPTTPSLTLRGSGDPAALPFVPERSLGGATWSSPETSGARFTYGFSLGESRWLGLQATYLFLGTRSLVQQGIDVDTAGSVSGRIPSVGMLAMALSSRVTGWEISTVADLHDSPGLRLIALTGYRYFQVHEGLRLDQTRLGIDSAGAIPGPWWQTADQVDGHNRFHGGQFGLQADLGSGPIFVEMTGKIAIGQTVGVVRRSGWTVGSPHAVPGLVMPLSNQGILVPAGATGRWQQRHFAVLPEATMKIGYQFASQSRFYLGYNFLYLNEAFRPGEQVDTTAELSEILPTSTGQRLGSTLRPIPSSERSDYWVQGLIFGLEYRY